MQQYYLTVFVFFYNMTNNIAYSTLSRRQKNPKNLQIKKKKIM